MSRELWDGVFAERSWGRWPSEAVVRSFSRLRESRTHPVVLEIGCGPGAQLRFLAEEGATTIGLDISTVALGQARIRLDSHGLQSGLLAGDAVVLPIRDQSVDVVIEVEALCCLDETHRASAWQEVARSLAPGGRFLSVAFSVGTEGLDTLERTSRLTFDAAEVGPFAGLGTLTLMDDDAIDYLAQQAGLRIVEVQTTSRTVGPDRLLVEEYVITASR